MKYLSLTFLLIAAACMPDEEPVVDIDIGADCGAEDYQWLVGKSLAAVTLPDDLMLRIIGPDTVVTMDYLPERMNVRHDDDSVIWMVNCG